MIILKPVATEKTVKLVELENTIVFVVDLRANKKEIAREIEKLFRVKVRKIRTLIKENEKIAYIKLDKKNPAIDIATKLGVM